MTMAMIQHFAVQRLRCLGLIMSHKGNINNKGTVPAEQRIANRIIQTCFRYVLDYTYILIIFLLCGYLCIKYEKMSNCCVGKIILSACF